MRLGIFGGSFDPIHRGHLEPVEVASRALDLDEVAYVPTAQPPHKPGLRFAPAHSRFTMVEFALLDRPQCWASSFELTPGARAYTVDTVEQLRQAYPGASLVLLLGADSWLQFDNWKNWQKILELAEVAVMARSGWRLADLSLGVSPELGTHVGGDRVHLVKNSPLAMSSSEIRRLLAEEPSAATSMLPDLVLRYINKYALYR